MHDPAAAAAAAAAAATVSIGVSAENNTVSRTSIIMLALPPLAMPQFPPLVPNEFLALVAIFCVCLGNLTEILPIAFDFLYISTTTSYYN